MPATYKILGQKNPALNTTEILYNVPVANSAIVSTVNICNQSNVGAAFRLAVRRANASLDASQYIAYDTIVPGNDSIALTLGLTLAATDTISCLANTSSIGFSAFGTEIN
jgi:hypothetical protein